jgi:hypothetical protein
MGKKGGSSKDASRAASVDRETARDQTWADRANQYNPFGAVEWSTRKTIDPATGKPVTQWTQQQSMSPQLEGIYNSQMSRMQGMGDLSAGMMGRVQNEMGSPADWGQFGDVVGMDYDPTELRQRSEDAAYQREAMRLDPQFAAAKNALEIKLNNQGLRAGDRAYDAEMERLNLQQNDAYERARLGSVQTGMSEAGQLWNQQLQGNEMANALRSQQIQEYLAKRQFSLGEAQALDPTGGLLEMSKVFTGGSGE